MNIAINTLALYKTKVGMGRYIVELVNRVPKLDAKNKYILYISKANQHFFDFAENVEVKRVPAFLTLPLLKIFWEHAILPFLLRKESVAVYHAPGFSIPVIMPKKIKSIVTIADMTFFSHSEHHTILKRLYFKIMIPHAVRRANAVIAISENTRQDVLRYINVLPEKVKTIYLGADDVFFKKKKEKSKVIDKYEIKKPYILFVGMLEPRKNVVGLIKAFVGMQDKDYVLVIAGKKGWMYKQIFKEVATLGISERVLFTGYVPDDELPKFYANATCFVYPSFYEGFGIPIIEAMAAGCPVITSNNSSMREIAGDAALLIEPRDPKSIADAMQRIVTDTNLQKKLKEKGRKQATLFRWEKMAKETITVYGDIVKLM